MKREKQEQLQRVWERLHKEISSLQTQITTLKNTIGQQDYSSLRFTEKAQEASNDLCKLLNDIFTADTQHGKSILGILKNTLQLQNDLSGSIKSMRDYGESLKSESVNLLQVDTRVEMLMGYLKETQNMIAKKSPLAKLSNFAKRITGAEKHKLAKNENINDANKDKRHRRQ